MECDCELFLTQTWLKFDAKSDLCIKNWFIDKLSELRAIFGSKYGNVFEAQTDIKLTPFELNLDQKYGFSVTNWPSTPNWDKNILVAKKIDFCKNWPKILMSYPQKFFKKLSLNSEIFFKNQKFWKKIHFQIF